VQTISTLNKWVGVSFNTKLAELFIYLVSGLSFEVWQPNQVKSWSHYFFLMQYYSWVLDFIHQKHFWWKIHNWLLAKFHEGSGKTIAWKKFSQFWLLYVCMTVLIDLLIEVLYIHIQKRQQIINNQWELLMNVANYFLLLKILPSYYLFLIIWILGKISKFPYQKEFTEIKVKVNVMM